MFVSAGVLDDQFFGGLAFERAGDFIAVGARNNFLAITITHDFARIKNALGQLLPPILRADAREVRAEITPLPFHRVAADTGNALQVEEKFPAPNGVAFGLHRELEIFIRIALLHYLLEQ